MAGFSVPSAIFGAFITAAFAYFVQLAISKRGDRKRQERLAQLYLIRITELVAIKKAIEYGFKDLINQYKEKSKQDEVGYILNRMCVYVSELISSKGGRPDETLVSSTQLKQIADVLKTRLDQDAYFGYKIQDELLSNLPAEAIVQYHFFIARVSNVHGALKALAAAFECKDFSLIDSNTLFNHITSFTKLIDGAEKLRAALIVKAKIKPEKAADILTQQWKFYTSEILAVQKDQKIMQIFKESVDKAKSDLRPTEKLSTGETVTAA